MVVTHAVVQRARALQQVGPPLTPLHEPLHRGVVALTSLGSLDEQLGSDGNSMAAEI